MPQDLPEQELDDSDTFVEIDPTGRYGRVSFHFIHNFFFFFFSSK